MFEKKPIELTKNELHYLFFIMDHEVQNQRFVVKGESDFDGDFSRSHFYFITAEGEKVASSLSSEDASSLSRQEKSDYRKSMLSKIFPKGTEVLQEKMVSAYTARLPLLMSRYITLDKSNFFQQPSLGVGFEHAPQVEKYFSIENGNAFLKIENTIQGCDCKIIANFFLNKEGFFELEKPIELFGEDAEFIHAVWFNDFLKMDNFWPKNLDKSLFDANMLNLKAQLDRELKEINRWYEAPGGAYLKEEPLKTGVKTFYNEINHVLNNSKHLTRKQQVLLSEALFRTTQGLMNRTEAGSWHFDWPSYISLANSLKANILHDKRFRLIVGSMLVIAALVLCAGLIAVSVSSFGIAPPLVLGAIIIASNLTAAIGATIAAVSAAALAITAGLFATTGKINTGGVEKAMKQIIKGIAPESIVVDSSEEELEEIRSAYEFPPRTLIF